MWSTQEQLNNEGWVVRLWSRLTGTVTCMARHNTGWDLQLSKTCCLVLWFEFALCEGQVSVSQKQPAMSRSQRLECFSHVSEFLPQAQWCHQTLQQRLLGERLVMVSQQRVAMSHRQQLEHSSHVSEVLPWAQWLCYRIQMLRWCLMVEGVGWWLLEAFDVSGVHEFFQWEAESRSQQYCYWKLLEMLAWMEFHWVLQWQL